MNYPNFRAAIAAIHMFSMPASAVVVNATYNSPTDVPVTAAGYTATGNTVDFTLNFAPSVGTNLTVVQNTGIAFIQGTFDNLAQGQQVDLTYAGVHYRFVVNYFGGSGNDLVLQWASTEVFAWGADGNGQLGNWSTTNCYSPVAVSRNCALTGKIAKSVCAGYSHTIVLCTDGTVVSWGWNDSGQLGIGSATLDTSSELKYCLLPVATDQTGVLAGKTVVAVSAGGNASLVLCSDGTVAAWGRGVEGQLGNGRSGVDSNADTPALVVQSGALAGKTVVAISAGYQHNLALCSDGTVVAWGANTYGQLGNNSTTNSNVPVLVNQAGVLAGKTVVKVSAGGYSSLALCSDGTVAAWGYNNYGQLGNGTTANSGIPVAVSKTGVLAGKTVLDMAAGYMHSLALCTDGSVVAWGSNTYGESGDGTTNSSSVPVLVKQDGVLAGKTVSGLAAGNACSFVLCTDGSVASWGANANGRLGNGTTTDSNVPGLIAPAPVLAGRSIVAISASEYGRGYALCADGTIAAWGTDMLGNGSSTGSTIPIAVSQTGVLSGKTVLNVAGGSGHSLALCSDGTIVAWGVKNYGVNPYYYRTMALAVPLPDALSGRTPVAISAGYKHSLTLLSDGTVAAWGDNYYGQLGTPAGSDGSGPVLVLSTGALVGKLVVAVGAGGMHSLCLSSDGSVAAWGGNDTGQLGNGTTAASTVPVAVSQTGVLAGKTVIALSAGYTHNLALCSDGTIAAWGNNGSGQLGDGSNVNRSLPVAVSQTGVLAGKTVVAISAGYSHSLAFCADGTIALWGNNSSGQLGNGSSANSNVPVLVDRTGVLAEKTVVAAQAGYSASFAICADGTVAAWGAGSSGQLGYGASGNSTVPVAVDLTGCLAGRTIGIVSAGSGFGLAVASPNIASDSTLADLAITNANINPAFTPTVVQYAATVSGPVDSVVVTPVVADPYASVKVNGTSVESGVATPPISLSLGSNDITVQVTAADGIGRTTYTITVFRGASIDYTYNSAAGVPMSTRSLDCTNLSAHLSLGFAPQAGTVLTVVDNTGSNPIGGRFGNLAQGQVVALSYHGVTYKFVANYHGGTGNDLVLEWGYRQPLSWGYNFSGQAGNGTAGYSPVPLGVTLAGVFAGKTVVAVSAGTDHSLALCSDGCVIAWGRNNYGQFGDGTNNDSAVPLLVSQTGVLAGKTVVKVLAADCHSLALCSDGALVAWGNNNNGQLGNGTTTNSSVPVLVTRTGVLSGKTVTTVAAGGFHCLALCSDGTVASWGYNNYGQLGNGTSIDSNIPVAVNQTGTLSGESVMAISAGANHTLALAASPIPGLSALTLDPGTLSPGFASNTTNYTGSVPPGATAVIVTPTATDSSATIMVNGTAVASGSPSGAIPLVAGAATIVVTVTAQDGIAATTYTVNIPNGPPVFSGYALSTPYQTAATVSLLKMLAKASDPDGDTVSVTAAGPASANGGSAVLRRHRLRHCRRAGIGQRRKRCPAMVNHPLHPA